LSFEEDEDDLDVFQGVGIIVNNRHLAALKHYRGHPEGQTTIYLPDTISDVNVITEVLRILLKALRLSEKALSWERRMNPEL
jgi:hypothetical protein